MEIFYSRFNFANWNIEELQQAIMDRPIFIKRKSISSISKDLINILPVESVKIASKTF